MTSYNLIFVITNTIYIYSVYLLSHAFFNQTTCNKMREKSILSIYFVAMTLIVFITRIPIVMLVLNISMILLLSFSYKVSVQKKIIYSSLIYSIMFIIELVIGVGIGFTDFSTQYDSEYNSVVGLVFIRVVTLIVAYVINRYKRTEKEDFTLPHVYYVAFIVILFGTLYLFVISLENDYITMRTILTSSIVLIVVNITMIFMDEKIYRGIVLEHEKNILNQQNIAYENQANIINQSTESIRMLKHDMKNHLMMLKQMHENNKTVELNQYLCTILESIEQETISACNNFVIDSIINFKLATWRNTDAKITLDISVPPTICIFAHDLTVVLGNLLDNALTAMEKATDKTLDLQISYKMGNLIILIDNSYNGQLVVSGGKFQTTKMLKANHGLGLASVEKSLERYGGEMHMEYTDSVFSVSVILPCKT